MTSTVESPRHQARRVSATELWRMSPGRVEHGVHAAKRAITSVKRGVEELAQLRDEGVHRVRRQPLGAVGIALGIGLVLGLAVRWIGRRAGRRE